MQLMNLLKQFLEYKYCKKIMKKHFNKNLIMSEKEEHLFQESNSCWIRKKLTDNDEEKVRDCCHVTGKFRGAAHRNFTINFKLTRKVPVTFHNLRGYDSHLIFKELKISWKSQTDQVNIIFPSTLRLKKRSYFPSPQSSKQEILGNQ